MLNAGSNSCMNEMIERSWDYLTNFDRLLKMWEFKSMAAITNRSLDCNGEMFRYWLINYKERNIQRLMDLSMYFMLERLTIDFIG